MRTQTDFENFRHFQHLKNDRFPKSTDGFPFRDYEIVGQLEGNRISTNNLPAWEQFDFVSHVGQTINRRNGLKFDSFICTVKEKSTIVIGKKNGK